MITLNDAVKTAKNISPESREQLKNLNIDDPEYAKANALTLQIAKETNFEAIRILYLSASAPDKAVQQFKNDGKVSPVFFDLVEIYTLDDFLMAFNSEEISDLGYVMSMVAPEHYYYYK